MPIEMDPARITPTAGKILVQITDQLGRTTKGGLFIPGTLEEKRWDRDTANGRILKMGLPPSVYWKNGEGRDVARDAQQRPLHGTVWPEEAVPFQVGDAVVFPRDVPLVIAWKEKRYALVMIHELLMAGDTDDIEFVCGTRPGSNMPSSWPESKGDEQDDGS